MSTHFDWFDFATPFKWSKAGNNIAKGAHNKAPKTERNFVSFFSRTTAQYVAKKQTNILETF